MPSGGPNGSLDFFFVFFCYSAKGTEDVKFRLFLRFHQWRSCISVYNTLMTTDQIVIDPNLYGGKPCIRGTQIAVTMVLELLEDGLTFEQVIADYYPQLKVDDIRACLKYARAVLEGEDIHLIDEKPSPEWNSLWINV